MPGTDGGEGRRVVITGAASGIGLATAEKFAASGALVAGIDRSDPPLGHDWPLLKADLARPDDVDIAMAAAADRLGGMDVLVCAAGITARGGLDDTTVEMWDQIFAVNVRAPFLCAKAAISHLRRSSRHPAIVNVASQYALIATGNYLAYCASKAALANLTRAMAIDCGREGIRVNTVCPGPTDTPMHRNDLAAGGLAAEGARASLARTIIGRASTAEEIAAAIFYLASPDAGSVVGATLVADGGFSIQ